MVDSISGKSNNIQDTGLLGLGQSQSSQSVEKVNIESAQDAAALSSTQLLDQATISDEARQAYENEKEVMRMSRLAQRIQEPYNADKVAQMKNLVDSGRINEYLRSVNTDELADSILNSPSGAFLK